METELSRNRRRSQAHRIVRGYRRANANARKRLIQEIRAVQRIPLLGDEPRIANQAAQLFLRRLVMRARGADHVFLDHDAAHVVAAEPQPELAGLSPGVTHDDCTFRMLGRYSRDSASILRYSTAVAS